MSELGLYAQVPEDERGLHPLWRQIETLDGRTFYLNPFTGRLSRQRFAAPGAPPGGILCDEMGLGKTVELLACIAANPFMGTFKVRCHIRSLDVKLRLRFMMGLYAPHVTC